MRFDASKLQKTKGYFEGTIEAVDEITAAAASDYKRKVCKNFIAISPDQIDSRVNGEDFYVTKKMDGEMSVLFFDGMDSYIINTGGKVRKGLPCVAEAEKILKEAGVESAVIPAELYVEETDGRTRVFEVLSALSKEEAIARLNLAPFDIVELNGKPFNADSYEETYKKLTELFQNSKKVRPVPYKKVSSRNEVKEIFSEWVEKQNAEGLVLRSNLPLVYKVKPKHNIDAVVIGYTESSGDSKGQIRTLLLALMTGENCYQIVGKTGNGFSDEHRKEFYEKFSKMHLNSKYIETDSSHVAFHMIRPETVIEISINDILVETGTSKIVNHVLEIKDDTYRLISSVPGVSFIYPVFERIRGDKKACMEDVRYSQVTDLVYIPDVDSCSSTKLPESEVIMREVYKKTVKDKLMVLKFVVWKTNKEQIDKNYPAYVMHFTNFSSDRKEPLQREVRISNNKDQILQIARSYIEENVKKGWIKVD
ncbi:MAG: hypothetical protein ACOYWZ_20870 [Bacillota bacterium]